jgi:hypothetical protein
VAYPQYLRDLALKLRLEERLSLIEISERLALPKTTVYYWVKDIPLQRPRRENNHPGNLAMQKKYRRIREEAFARGRDEFDDLAAADPSFRDFVALYIAEGYKRNRNRVSIANSDPAVIVFSAAWIRRFSERSLDCSLQYHADQSPKQLRGFWGERLGVEPDSIRLQRKSNSSQLAQRKWRCKHGVLSVGVGDTALRARLQGWIESIQEQWLDSAVLGA